MRTTDRGLHSTGLVGTLEQTPLRRSLLFAPCIGVLLVAGGCLKSKVGFDSPAPSKRLEAIARSSQEDDQATRIQLVEKLGSLDPAERMLAIRALEVREGTTLGYDHAAPTWQRLEAIERWRVYIGMDSEGQENKGLSDDTGDLDDPPMTEDSGQGTP